MGRLPFISGSEKGVFWKKGSSFQKSPFSRDSREPPDCGKQRTIRPFSRDSRESRDFRDSSCDGLREPQDQKSPKK